MTALCSDEYTARGGDTYLVPIASPDDFDGWRHRARQLVQAGIAPDRIVWAGGDGAPDDGGETLFARREGGLSPSLPMPPANAPRPRGSRAFLDAAQTAIMHSDPARFGLLYRLLWRLQHAPQLMDDAADEDVRRISRMTQSVRRDMHKMRAFVRFRAVEGEAGAEPCYVAWFEPDHYILRANAAFFTSRFASMRWSILTPKGSIIWDGRRVHEGPPARRSDAPEDDPVEALWRNYYAAIFNPARLKVGAMLKEMPRRYWKNMPETALIPDLIAGAQAREAVMMKQDRPLKRRRIPL